MSEIMNCNLEKDKGLVIIGNGFDLYHNLPTRFSDFFELIDNFDKIVKSLPHGIRYKQNNINIGKIKFDDKASDQVNAFRDFMEKATFSEHQICNFRELIKKTDKFENRIFEYFKFLKKVCGENSSMNWCDFEMNIDELLHIVKDYFNSAINYRIHERYKNGTYLYRRKYDEIVKLFINNIIVKQRSSLDDLEDKVVDKILPDFKKFKNAFAIYIDEYINQMKVDVCSLQLKEFSDQYYMYTLSFNYTDYSHFGIYFREMENVMYIHGRSSRTVKDNINIDEYKRNEVVIGIPDNSFDDSKYFEFQKFFQRTVCHNPGITDHYLDSFKKNNNIWALTS